MHLVRCLAFVAEKFNFVVVSSHIKGRDNDLADALSRDRAKYFLSHYLQAQPHPSEILRIAGLSSGGETQLDLQELDQSVKFYFQNALAPPNKKRLTSQQRPVICNFVQKGASVLCPSQNINCANMLPT